LAHEFTFHHPYPTTNKQPRYFQCDPGHGIIAALEKLTLLGYDQKGVDESEGLQAGVVETADGDMIAAPMVS
jgi:hypothetical protein